MSLLTRISIPPPIEPEAEDIFSSALTTIFTDDAINSWGSPGASIVYQSPRYGPITLRVPIHPDEEQGRKLFAHYLWNAGVLAADLIETASSDAAETVVSTDLGRQYWDVRGQHVLEIGAATALPSLVCALSSAATVTITDHPSSPALTAGGIQQNVAANLFTSTPSSPSQARTATPVSIHGYTWGTSLFYDPSSYGRPVSPPDPATLHEGTELTAKGYPRPHKIIVADCLWMPSQHGNIVKTILDFLAERPPPERTPPSNEATGEAANLNGKVQASAPAALITAGFHTGRAIVRDFFTLALGWHLTAQSATAATTEETVEAPQLRLAQIYETDMEGNTRDWIWDDVREGEGKWEAKRWCVVAVLIRGSRSRT